jgi:hypothetical protein
VVDDQSAARFRLDERVHAERRQPEVMPERLPVRIAWIRIRNPRDLVEPFDRETQHPDPPSNAKSPGTP